jgi:hypothetical protein
MCLPWQERKEEASFMGAWTLYNTLYVFKKTALQDSPEF